MKKIVNTLSAAALAVSMSTAVQAADEVNVAYFLEWATPNLIAKNEGAYDDALGVPVNWTAFEAGTQMTEAMLSGDIDISYSQGLAPFITAINSNTPIKMVAIAVQYSANPCVVKTGAGIDSSNASELEGQTVAVPLSTMADYSFRMQMRALDVDVSKITVVDQVPADAAVSLADGSVVMACGFGGLAIASMLESGDQLMSSEEMVDAGIISFDVVSVSEKFAQENPEMIKAFLDVTEEANAAFAADQGKIGILATESGMTEEGTMTQMSDFVMPSAEQQLNEYFNEGGLASVAIGVVGNAFATPENPARDDYSATIDTSFLK